MNQRVCLIWLLQRSLASLVSTGGYLSLLLPTATGTGGAGAEPGYMQGCLGWETGVSLQWGLRVNRSLGGRRNGVVAPSLSAKQRDTDHDARAPVSADRQLCSPCPHCPHVQEAGSLEHKRVCCQIQRHDLSCRRNTNFQMSPLTW